MTRAATIGCDRKLRLEWLDMAAARAIAGDSERQAHAALMAALAGDLGGEGVHGARGKTVTVLLGVWYRSPERIRETAKRLVAEVPADERVAVHWALCLAAYPFFRDVAGAAGRLISLHGTASVIQVQRRVTETWGSRSTIPPAVQRLVRSMYEWGVLVESARGEYGPKGARPAVTGEAAELLVAAALGVGGARPLSEVVGSGRLFPFDIHVGGRQPQGKSLLSTTREGMDVTMVEVRG